MFRQARATGLTAALVALAPLATVAAATARHADGRLVDAFFGAVTCGSTDSAEQASRFCGPIIGGVAADTVGVLLALVWTAGFLPAFVDPAVRQRAAGEAAGPLPVVLRQVARRAGLRAAYALASSH